MTADSMRTVGFAFPCPAMSGALPCTASNTAWLSPMLAPGTMPIPPTSPADKPGGNIGDDVAIEIRQQQDVECFRPQDKLHGRVIDNQFLY
jgi:hypothetical protein